MSTTTVDPTTITGPLTPYNTREDDIAERIAEISDSWWNAARAAGFRDEDVEHDTFCYDTHLSIDGVRTPDGKHIEDDQAGDAFGYLGRFYLVAAYGDSAICLPMDINDECPNCGGEADLAPRAGCAAHISTDTDDEN